MRDDRIERGEKPVNRRNTLIALGAIGAIVLVSNISLPGLSFVLDSDEPEIAARAVAESRVEAAADRLEASIEARVERDLDAAADRLDDAPLDDPDMEAAIEDLKQGDPDRFIELMKEI